MVWLLARDHTPVDPDHEPEGFRERLAKAAGFSGFDALKAGLTEARAAARAAFEAALPPVGDGD